MKGELNGKVGMFPVGFVEIIEDLPPAVESVNALHGGSEDGSTVLFDFLGQSGELSLLSGTRVKILGVVNSEWLFGEFEGQKGRFPRAFVDHVPSGLPHFEDEQPQTIHDKVNDGPHCIALYNFVGQNPDDLSFSAGDCISLLTRVSDDWLRGEVNGRQGIFPASFVQIVKDVDELPPRPKVTPVHDATPVDASRNLTAHDTSNVNVESALKAKSDSVPLAEKSTQAVAIYDFPGQTEDDLTFHIGEVIEVTGVIDGDWMSGRIGVRSGIFPASFVNILS